MAERTYSREELTSIYELGRLYFEMGYVAPAERIFSGLSGIDNHLTPSRIGLGLLKIERGLFQEATNVFRSVVQAGTFTLSAKLGLAIAFIGQQELGRARSLLSELEKEVADAPQETKQLVEALNKRCSG